MESVQGRALVASPYLSDPNFMRSVVYMLQDDDDGALGVVLNRPTDRSVASLLEAISDEKVTADSAIHWGGPIDGPLMLLQELRGEGTSGIFAASEQERILEICREGLGSSDDEDDESSTRPIAGSYRVFDGYAGWGVEQLRHELKDGGWLIWDIEPQQIFADTENLWEDALKMIGRDILTAGIDPSLLPENPACN
ncbi:MAG: YqgE/AlgH family protein [Aureliella sp.]